MKINKFKNKTNTGNQTSRHSSFSGGIIWIHLRSTLGICLLLRRFDFQSQAGGLEAPLSQRERDIWERGRFGIIGSSLRIISGLGIICGTVQHWYFVVLASGKTTTTTTTTTSQAQKIFIPRICIDDTRVLFLRREHCRRTAGNVCRL